MHEVIVTALRDFPYRDQTVRKGAVLRMAPVDAAIAVRNQDVSASQHKTRDPESLETPQVSVPESPEEPVIPPPRRRRRYRRRDLVAED